MKKAYKIFARSMLGMLAFGLSFSSYGQIASYPFTEGFEGGSIPTDWTQEYVSGTTDWAVVSTNGDNSVSPRNGSGMAEFLKSNSVESTKLVTPQLDLTSLTSPQLVFYFANANWLGDVDELRIYYKAAVGDSWTQLGSDYITEHASWTEVTFSLPSPTSDYYIAFEGKSNYARGLDIDDVLIGEAPTCLKPTALSVSVTTDQTADVTWTAGDSEGAWNISWGTPGYTPGDANEIATVNTGSNPYQIVGLTGNTDYDVYVQADCGGGDESVWIGPLTITTLPTPQTPATTPWNEDWESGGSDWTILNGTETNQWVVGTAVNNGGANSLYISNDGGTTNAYGNTSSVSFAYRDITMPTSYAEATVSFDWQAEGESGFSDYDYLSVWAVPLSTVIVPGTELSATGNAPAGIIDLTNGLFENATFVNESFTIPAAYAGESFRLVFQWKNDGGTNNDPPAAVDNINISTFDCLSPTGIGATAINVNDVDIEWTEAGSSSTWNVEVGTTGFVPGAGNEVDADNGTTTQSSTLSGLSDNVEYDVYVQADCGTGDESAWAGPFTFTTSCSSTNIPYVQDFESATTPSLPSCTSNENVGTGNDWKTNSVNGSGFSSIVLNYSYNYSNAADTWFYTQGINLTAGTIYQITYDYGDNGYVEKLKVAYGTSPSSASMTNNIDDHTTAGNSTLESNIFIFTAPTTDVYYFGFNAHSASNQNQLYVDNIVVDAAPACPDPTGLDTTAMSLLTADITWSAGFTESAWNVSWGTPGYTPGDADEIGNQNVTSNSYQITGLTGDTHYDVYVQADCGGDQSTWIGPLNIYKGYCIPTNNYSTSYYISGVSTSGAAQNLNNTGTGFGTDGFSDYTATDTLIVYPGQVIDFTFEHPSSTYDYNVWVDWDYNLDFADAGDEIIATTSAQTSPYTISYTVPLGTPLTTTRLRVRNANTYSSGSAPACGSFNYGEAEDYILKVVAVPTCLQPTAIDTTAISGITMDIEWTAGGTESTWNVSWGTPGYTPGDANEVGTEIGVASNSYQITGLTGNTEYDVYVQADCGGGDESYWAGPFTVTTACTATNVPYVQNFESATTPNMPSCTSTENVGSGNNWKTASQTSYGFNSIVLQYTYASSPADTWFYTQGVNLTAGTEYQIRYDYGNNSTGYDEKLKVAYGTSANSTSMINVVDDHTVNSATKESNAFIFIAPTTDVYYFGFNAHSAANQYYLYVDSIVVDLAPACLEPTDLAIVSVSDITADVSWTPGATETAWNVSWGTPGYTPGDANEVGTEIGVTASPYQITGLTADTHYDVYVQADCGSDQSVWAGPLDIFTGYCEVSSGTYNSDYLTSIVSNGAVTDVSYTATSSPSGDYADETSQTFESYENQTFNVNTDYVGGVNTVKIWVDWNNNFAFDSGELVASGNAVSNQTFSITVPSGTPQGDYRMRVRGMYDNSNTGDVDPCGEVTYGSTVDFNLSIVAPPSCIEPSTLSIIDLSDQTVDVAWVSGGTESAWNISWGTPGYVPGDANEVGTAVSSTNPYQITGLTPDTHYDVYVQADCGGGDESVWFGPLEVYTEYCEVSTTYITYYLSSVETEGAVSNVSYTASAQPSGSYSDETTQTFMSYEGQTFDFNTTFSTTSNGVNIWIDLNDNMVFEPSELIATQANSDAAKTFTFTVPTGTPLGDYRVRVRGQYGSTANPPACGNVNYGSTVDFNLTIVPVPTCLQPTDLFVSPIYADSAVVNWANGGSTVGSWNIVWGPPGFTPGDADQIGSATATGLAYTLTGLVDGTEYDVYIQSDCGGGDESYWSGPSTFSNIYCTPPANSSTYHIDDVVTTGALINLNNTGSGTSPGGYGDFTSTDTLVVYPGQIIDFSIAGSSSSMNYFAWIDWFQNANFDEPIELIESTTGYVTSPHSFTYTIPTTIPEMTTRLRVRATWLGSNLTPCEANTYAETEDYIIKIVAAPSCLPPINVDSLSITTTDVELGWDEQNTATAWNIEYGPTGFTPGTGTVIPGVSTNPYTVTGLDPSTTYDFYVQSDCGGNDESYWGGPLTVQTLCDVTMAPFFEGFNTGDRPNCWANVSSDPSTSINNYWKFSGTVEFGAVYNGKPAGTYAISDGDTPRPDSMMLITPEIDISTLTNPALSFEWFSNNTNNPGDNVPLIVLVTTDNINWITLDTLKGDNSQWQFASYDLNAFANDTIRVIFMTNQSVTTNSSYYNDILLDDVRIDDCLSGQPGSKNVCRLDGTIDLNDNIIVPPNSGGKWYGGTTLDGLVTNDSILNISSLPAGSYDVYYSERTVCYDTTVATIVVYGPSSAGDGNTIHACKYEPLNLFAALTGNADLDGSWYDFDGNVLPNSQPTTPGIEASYNYQYIVSNGVCPADTSVVEVVIDNCTWVGLDEEAFTDITVYPNPATDQINIMNPSNASNLKVVVLDVNGRVVLTDNDVMKNTSKATIAIDQLAKGIYTLRVYNSEGQKVFKVVKQ